MIWLLRYDILGNVNKNTVLNAGFKDNWNTNHDCSLVLWNILNTLFRLTNFKLELPINRFHQTKSVSNK